MASDARGLSVVVITLNEARNIRDCLQSVIWADELIVVDAGSTDDTARIARECGAAVHLRKWEGFAAAKEYGVSLATGRWILWLDADERVSADLREEIRRVVASDHQGPPAYCMPRKAIFLGKWIRHCGWYPGYVTRLFRRGEARFSKAGVHERLEFSGTPARLQGDIVHYTDDNLFHYFAKYNSYTSLAAQELWKNRKTVSAGDLLFRPLFQFFKMYVMRLGFLDGMHGLVVSVASATYVFVKYAKTWELGQLRPD